LGEYRNAPGNTDSVHGRSVSDRLHDWSQEQSTGQADRTDRADSGWNRYGISCGNGTGAGEEEAGEEAKKTTAFLTYRPFYQDVRGKKDGLAVRASSLQAARTAAFFILKLFYKTLDKWE